MPRLCKPTLAFMVPLVRHSAVATTVRMLLLVGAATGGERSVSLEPKPTVVQRVQGDLAARSVALRSNLDFGWTDLAIRSSHRLQEHADGKLHRVVNGDHRIVVWGSIAEARRRLEQLDPKPSAKVESPPSHSGPASVQAAKADSTAEPAAEPLRGRSEAPANAAKVTLAAATLPRQTRTLPDLVILIHGLGRTPTQMSGLERAARREGFDAISFGYASQHITVERAGEALRSVIRDQVGPRRIHLVGFSLGGLVIRSALAERPDPRVQRVVMIGTPNRGSEHADWWNRFSWVAPLVGPSAWRLGTGPSGVAARLPSPPVPFAVIAGSKGDGDGWSATIPGDDDLLVGVHSALLPGATAARVLRATHPGLIRSAETSRLTFQFLRSGSFGERPSRGR